MYNEMMASVLEMTFLPCISPKLQEKVNFGFWDEISVNAESHPSAAESCSPEYERDTEPLVGEKHASSSAASVIEGSTVAPTTESASSSATDSSTGNQNFKNLFRWKSYTLKLREQVLAIYN